MFIIHISFEYVVYCTLYFKKSFLYTLKQYAKQSSTKRYYSNYRKTPAGDVDTPFTLIDSTLLSTTFSSHIGNEVIKWLPPFFASNPSPKHSPSLYVWCIYIVPAKQSCVCCLKSSRNYMPAQFAYIHIYTMSDILHPLLSTWSIVRSNKTNSLKPFSR